MDEPVNDLAILKYSSDLIFATCGKSTIKLWKVDLGNTNDLLFLDVPLSEPELNYTAIECTNSLSAPYDCSIVLIGTSDGDIILYNPETNEFLAKVVKVSESEIGLIKISNSGILIGDSTGNLTKHTITPGSELFSQVATNLTFDSPVVSCSFDEDMNEGQIGLMGGSWR